MKNSNKYLVVLGIIMSITMSSTVVIAQTTGKTKTNGLHLSPKVINALKDLSNSKMKNGVVHFMASSHQDIAWVDAPQQCRINRDKLLITPTLKKIGNNSNYRYDMENALMLREYLNRHPDRKDEIEKYTEEGKLGWGAAYNAPYEDMYYGEALVRQFYQGKRYLMKEFPGVDPVIYWNVDVPGRTPQMLQILKKAGVKYLMLSRFEQGLYKWKSPDGSGVYVYSPGHYYDFYSALNQNGAYSYVPFIANLADKWSNYNTVKSATPALPALYDADMLTPPDFTKYVNRWNRLNGLKLKSDDGKTTEVNLPQLKPSLGKEFMSAMVKANDNLPVIEGARPNVWVYIHGPSHHKALSASRKSAKYLTAAEKFSTIEAQLNGSFRDYPQKDLNKAWAAAIYPDHGWGGKFGNITDSLFKKKVRYARDRGKKIRDTAMESIAGRISTASNKGKPIVVFNSLSWERSGPVTVNAKFDQGEAENVRLIDSDGQELTKQVLATDTYSDGSMKSVKFMFIANQVPSIGYHTYYLRSTKSKNKSLNNDSSNGDQDIVENKFYKIILGPGGIEQIVDKNLNRNLLNTDKFLGGEIFTMESKGNGAGEFAEIQQPTMDGFDKLSNYRPTHNIASKWKHIESGPVRDVYQYTQPMKHTTVVEKVIVYNEIKRIDFNVTLNNFDGTPYREYRMAMPLAMNDGQVTYEAPFTALEVGKDEMEGAAGERYITKASKVHPRGINDWIDASNDNFGLTMSSSVAVADYIDPTNNPASYPILQPILLASRRSCHGLGLMYRQIGTHTFTFSLSSHQGGWKNGYKTGDGANEPMTAIFNPTQNKRATLPSNQSFYSVDADNIEITAVKKAEDSNDIVVRFYDAEGIDKKDATIHSFKSIKKAELTNIIENKGKPISHNSHNVNLNVSHNSIETIKIDN